MENIVEIASHGSVEKNDPLRDVFERQKQDYVSASYPTLEIRKDRLQRGRAAVVKNRDRIVEAINADFGNRPRLISLLADVLVPVRALKNAESNLKKWMKPEKRAADFPLGLIGARAYIQYQPLGVVGIMAPWNAPVALCMTPLAGVLAAGNRAMMKPSEFSPATSEVVREIIEDAFSPEEVAVVTGGVETAKAFSSLPFDHLLYTGGASIARHVMRAASENLTPVTLELGGKSPAIVAENADVAAAAKSIVNGRLTNGGQICMAPDYALVWRPYVDEFRKEAIAAIKSFFPVEKAGVDLTNLMGSNARERRNALLEEAKNLGAQVDVIDVAPPGHSDSSVPPSLVTGPEVSSRVMREEIFGPILPIVPFDTTEDIFEIARGIDKPLAAYVFGGSKAVEKRIIRELSVGGMTIGDVMLHPFLQNLPFGGVGESGMGRYVGHDGFKTFSNGKSVLHRPWIDVGKYLFPPYTEKMESLLEKAIKF